MSHTIGLLPLPTRVSAPSTLFRPVIVFLSCRRIGKIAHPPSPFSCSRSVGASTINRMLKVLPCLPNYFDVVDQKNPYMARESAVDRVKARSQWDALCSVLQQNGCEVEPIDPVEGLEDMVFAADQLFAGEKNGHGKFVVPSHMVYASRQRGVPFYKDWCRARDYQVIDLDYGDVVPLQLVDPYCYHLDTCLCPLNDESALIFPRAYSAEALASLHKLWIRVHLLTAAEAHPFMGNGIAVNGSYIAPCVTPPVEDILRLEGLTPVIVDTSEFEKAGGSCFSMKTFLP
jgi:N-dimethylarginine dimethylaminohydrolase